MYSHEESKTSQECAMDSETFGETKNQKRFVTNTDLCKRRQRTEVLPGHIEKHLEIGWRPIDGEDPSFFRRYKSLELRQAREKLNLIKKCRDRFPPELLSEYYDVLIVYSDADIEEAKIFCQSMKELQLESGTKVKAVLYDDETFQNNTKHEPFGSLEEVFEKCTNVFVYLTQNFCSLMENDTCLKEAIENSASEWRIVPVYTMAREDVRFNIPFSLRALKGLNFFYNDESCEKVLRKYMANEVKRRLDNEEMMFHKQYEEALRIVETENRQHHDSRQMNKPDRPSSHNAVEASHNAVEGMEEDKPDQPAQRWLHSKEDVETMEWIPSLPPIHSFFTEPRGNI